MATKKRASKSESVGVEIPALNIHSLELTLVGDSPLICHAWSHKAKKAILDTHMKLAKQAREAKDPEQDFKDSLYALPEGGFGFPAIGFKSAAVDACSHVAEMTKVEARGAFHLIGDMVKINGEPTPREDMVRLNGLKPDIRFRGEFKRWKAKLFIRYNANVLSPSQIANLFNTAGFAIGVGEWRPQRDGSFGMFHVAGEREL